MENHLARRIGVGCPDISSEQVKDVHSKLEIVPRVGLGVISTIFMLILSAVRA